MILERVRAGYTFAVTHSPPNSTYGTKLAVLLEGPSSIRERPLPEGRGYQDDHGNEVLSSFSFSLSGARVHGYICECLPVRVGVCLLVASHRGSR